MTEKPQAPSNCLMCGKPARTKTHPFCSERCRLVDLNRWLNGSYAIPASDNIPDEDDTQERSN